MVMLSELEGLTVKEPPDVVILGIDKAESNPWVRPCGFAVLRPMTRFADESNLEEYVAEPVSWPVPETATAKSAAANTVTGGAAP